MSDNIIYVKSISAPPVDRREVLRYAGRGEYTEETEVVLDECICEAERVLSYKLCYRFYDISMTDDEIDLGFAKTTSRSLLKRLVGCDRIILFCATVGTEMDRIMRKYSCTSLAKAVILQAIGSERVEALCDAFCEEMSGAEGEMGRVCTERFSPGYGDLPLDLQEPIFKALDPTRRLGVTLNDNLFMTPSKSVTAIIGIKNVK